MTDRFANHDIQVSGIANFAASEWRNALIHFVSGVWGRKHEVMYRPKLSFDRFTLRLDQGSGEYWAHTNEPADPAPMPFFSDTAALVVNERQLVVETALLLFVWNDGIKMLVIKLGSTGLIRLWKGKNRGELFCACSGLPSQEEVQQEYREQLAMKG